MKNLKFKYIFRLFSTSKRKQNLLKLNIRKKDVEKIKQKWIKDFDWENNYVNKVSEKKISESYLEKNNEKKNDLFRPLDYTELLPLPTEFFGLKNVIKISNFLVSSSIMEDDMLIKNFFKKFGIDVGKIIYLSNDIYRPNGDIIIELKKINKNQIDKIKKINFIGISSIPLNHINKSFDIEDNKITNKLKNLNLTKNDYLKNINLIKNNKISLKILLEIKKLILNEISKITNNINKQRTESKKLVELFQCFEISKDDFINRMKEYKLNAIHFFEKFISVDEGKHFINKILIDLSYNDTNLVNEEKSLLLKALMIFDENGIRSDEVEELIGRMVGSQRGALAYKKLLEFFSKNEIKKDEKGIGNFESLKPLHNMNTDEKIELLSLNSISNFKDGNLPTYYNNICKSILIIDEYNDKINQIEKEIDSLKDKFQPINKEIDNKNNEIKELNEKNNILNKINKLIENKEKIERNKELLKKLETKIEFIEWDGEKAKQPIWSYCK